MVGANQKQHCTGQLQKKYRCPTSLTVLLISLRHSELITRKHLFVLQTGIHSTLQYNSILYVSRCTYLQKIKNFFQLIVGTVFLLPSAPLLHEVYWLNFKESEYARVCFIINEGMLIIEDK